MKQYLHGAWSLLRTNSTNVPDRWGDAWQVTVPGEVHRQLQKAGVISDPFIECGFISYMDMERSHWWYRREFDVLPVDGESLVLVCEGIDACSEVWLNGVRVACFEGMFACPDVDVTKYLRRGTNEILVHILPADTEPENACASYEAGIPFDHDLVASHRYLKPPHLLGGNGFPQRVVTAGIWLPMYLESRLPGELTDVYVATTTASASAAQLQVVLEASRTSEFTHIDLEIVGPGSERRVSQHSADFSAGVAILDITVDHPALWWPNGHGDQPLYRLQARFRGSKRTVSTRFGIRQVRWCRNTGTSATLTIEVNGKRVFARGANWAALDRLLALDHDRYEDMLQLAVTANVNFFRVWAGVPREARGFYERCDELGLLLLHDLILPNTMNQMSCLSAVDRDIYLRQITRLVRDLRGHCSIIGWCGGNELRMAEVNGSPLRDLVEQGRDLVQALDPHRRFFLSSYDLQSGLTDDYEHYGRLIPGVEQLDLALRSEPKFSIEFHSASHHHVQVPSLTSLRRFLPHSTDMWPPPKNVHLCKINGVPWTQSFVPGTLPIDVEAETAAPYRSWSELAYYSQMFHAFGVRSLVAHWRARLFYCSGSAVWCWNDSMPMIGSGVVDYYGQPKAAYYMLKQAYAPVSVSLRYDGPRRDIRDRPRGWVRVINESGAPFTNYHVEVRIFDSLLREVLVIGPNGTTISRGLPEVATAVLPTNTRIDLRTECNAIPDGTALEVLDLNGLGYLFPLHTFMGVPEGAVQPGKRETAHPLFFSILITLRHHAGDVIEQAWYPYNFEWHDSASIRSLPQSEIALRPAVGEDGVTEYTIVNHGDIIAPWILIEPLGADCPLVLSDNCITLLPGESRRVQALSGSDTELRLRGINCVNTCSQCM